MSADVINLVWVLWVFVSAALLAVIAWALVHILLTLKDWSR